ncbi:hypothetical protein GCM10027022_05840 [Alpinimonas psychrophila]
MRAPFGPEIEIHPVSVSQFTGHSGQLLWATLTDWNLDAGGPGIGLNGQRDDCSTDSITRCASPHIRSTFAEWVRLALSVGDDSLLVER